jgi:ABC-type nitrate/sulfonate/bicarbonate transport system permease component
MRRLLVGYLAGVGAGSVIGVAFGSSRLLRLTFRPVAVFFRAVPPVVLLPVALLLFGSGDAEKIFLIAFMCVWPILLNAEDGVAGIDATVRDAARAYGIRGWRRLWYVTLPAILPRVFAGMRISLSFAVLLLVVAELYGSLNGVGHVVQVEANSYDIAQMWSGVLMLGLIGYVLNMILLWAEHHVIRWHQMRRRDAA